MPVVCCVVCGRVPHALARVQYMISPGNHDAIFEFASYRARFKMPFESSGGINNLYACARAFASRLDLPRNSYYSFQYRNLHFLVFATDDIPDDSIKQFKPGALPAR